MDVFMNPDQLKQWRAEIDSALEKDAVHWISRRCDVIRKLCQFVVLLLVLPLVLFALGMCLAWDGIAEFLGWSDHV